VSETYYREIADPLRPLVYQRLAKIPWDVNAPSYIIFQDEGLVKAKNGLTGEIDFEGTDAATVIQQAIDALPTPSIDDLGYRGAGSIVIKQGNYELTQGITVKLGVELRGTGRTSQLYLKSPLTDPYIRLLSAAKLSNLTIWAKRDLTAGDIANAVKVEAVDGSAVCDGYITDVWIEGGIAGNNVVTVGLYIHGGDWILNNVNLANSDTNLKLVDCSHIIGSNLALYRGNKALHLAGNTRYTNLGSVNAWDGGQVVFDSTTAYNHISNLNIKNSYLTSLILRGTRNSIGILDITNPNENDAADEGGVTIENATSVSIGEVLVIDERDPKRSRFGIKIEPTATNTSLGMLRLAGSALGGYMDELLDRSLCTFSARDPLRTQIRTFSTFWYNNHWLPAGMLNNGVTNTGDIAWSSDYVELITGTTASSTAWVLKTAWGTDGTVTWNRRRYFGVSIRTQEIADQVIHIVQGGVSDYTSATNTSPHIGFKIVNDTVYGTVGNDTAESEIALHTLTGALSYRLEAILLPNREVLFYFNEEYVDSITTNIPTGSTEAHCWLRASICNTAAANKVLFIYVVASEQEEETSD